MIKWLHHHTRCPTSLNIIKEIKEKKIKKRNKPENKHNSAGPNTISTVTQQNNLTELSNNHHFEHQRDQQQEQALDSPEEVYLNYSSIEKNHSTKKSNKTSKTTSHFSNRQRHLILDESIFLNLNRQRNIDVIAGVSDEEEEREDDEEENSSGSSASATSSNNSSGDNEAISNNNSNMIMTASNTASTSFPVTSASLSTPTSSDSSSTQINVNYNNSSDQQQHNQSSAIVKQPQFVSNKMLSNNLSKSFQQNQNIFHQKQPNNINTATNAQTSTQSNSNSSTSNNNRICSYSYLDENNLKIAIIDYPDLLKLIKLQSSIDLNEWLAFNTKMYFDQINVLYGAIAEHCTLQSCPTMNAPLNNQFYWLDEKGKKCKYSASQYIDTVLTQTAKVISDESHFPTQVGHPFSSHFDNLVKKIHKNLFQILAHMYHSHYKELVQLKLNTYVNSIYFHLLMFSKTFNTLEDKDTDIMDALNKSLMNKYMGTLTQQQQQGVFFNQQPPTIHQPVISAPASSSSSSSSSGFSFFKKKLNFNLMA